MGRATHEFKLQPKYLLTVDYSVVILHYYEFYCSRSFLVQNERIDGTLEMMSVAPTNERKHVTSNIPCAHSQRYTIDSVF